MGYQKDRDEFLHIIQQEGLHYSKATKLLRYAQTLQRLAEAECNGDYPADNGERKVNECPRCGSGYVPSSFRFSAFKDVDDKTNRETVRYKVCPDCRTRELVDLQLPQGFKAIHQGDPRGCVLKIQRSKFQAVKPTTGDTRVFASQ